MDNKKLTENEEITAGNIKEKAKAILPPEDIDEHDGDLYLKVSDKSTELVNKMKDKDSGLLSIFKDQINEDLWYDIPFANMSDNIKTKQTENKQDNENLKNIKEVIKEAGIKTPRTIELLANDILKDLQDNPDKDIQMDGIYMQPAIINALSERIEKITGKIPSIEFGAKKEVKRLKENNNMERYQVREYDEGGYDWGVYDTKEKKFVQKGSKKVMIAAASDLNNKSIKKENVSDSWVEINSDLKFNELTGEYIGTAKAQLANAEEAEDLSGEPVFNEETKKTLINYGDTVVSIINQDRGVGENWLPTDKIIIEPVKAEIKEEDYKDDILANRDNITNGDDVLLNGDEDPIDLDMDDFEELFSDEVLYTEEANRIRTIIQEDLTDEERAVLYSKVTGEEITEIEEFWDWLDGLDSDEIENLAQYVNEDYEELDSDEDINYSKSEVIDGHWVTTPTDKDGNPIGDPVIDDDLIEESKLTEANIGNKEYYLKNLGLDPFNVDYSKNNKAYEIYKKFEEANKLDELFMYLEAGISEPFKNETDYLVYVADTDIADYEIYNGKLNESKLIESDATEDFISDLKNLLNKYCRMSIKNMTLEKNNEVVNIDGKEISIEGDSNLAAIYDIIKNIK